METSWIHVIRNGKGSAANVCVRQRGSFFWDTIHTGKFGEKAPQMLEQYEVPVYFREDFFSVLEGGNQHRPSYRWILVGPKKTGSSFHKDPNATSAWNGLIYGLKKWILFPPDEIPPGGIPSVSLIFQGYSQVRMNWK